MVIRCSQAPQARGHWFDPSCAHQGNHLSAIMEPSLCAINVALRAARTVVLAALEGLDLRTHRVRQGLLDFLLRPPARQWPQASDPAGIGSRARDDRRGHAEASDLRLRFASTPPNGCPTTAPFESSSAPNPRATGQAGRQLRECARAYATEASHRPDHRTSAAEVPPVLASGEFGGARDYRGQVACLTVGAALERGAVAPAEHGVQQAGHGGVFAGIGQGVPDVLKQQARDGR